MSIMNTEEFEKANVGDVIVYAGIPKCKFLKCSQEHHQGGSKPIDYFLYSFSQKDPAKINWIMDKLVAEHLIKELGMCVTENIIYDHFEDNMYWPKPKNTEWSPNQRKFYESRPAKGTRYIAKCTITYMDRSTTIARQASPDNVSAWCWKNCSELAMKRALVATVCQLLNITANIDASFPEYANFNVSPDEFKEEIEDSLGGFDIGDDASPEKTVVITKLATPEQKKVLDKRKIEYPDKLEYEGAQKLIKNTEKAKKKK